MVTFALSIPHCPWDPHRVKSLERLRASLFGSARLNDDIHAPAESFRVFGDVGPTPNHVWAERVWRWGEEQADASHLLQLQDDVIPMPDRFWSVLTAMVEAAPAVPICLFTIHPIARALRREGCAWFSTSDLWVGPAWAVPREIVRDYNAWRVHGARPGAVQHVNEDTLFGLYCAATGRRIWHPTVSIVDHDTSLDSHYGNKAANHNRPSCSWLDADLPESWAPTNPLHQPNGEVPHLGRIYSFTPYSYAKWVLDGPAWLERLERLERDVIDIATPVPRPIMEVRDDAPAP